MEDIKKAHYNEMEAALESYKVACSKIAEEAKEKAKAANDNKELLQDALIWQKGQLEKVYLQLKEMIEKAKKDFFGDIEKQSHAKDEQDLERMDEMLKNL